MSDDPDLSEFLADETGTARTTATPPAQFTFKPGAETGEATFVASETDDLQDALDLWAAKLLGLNCGVMALLEVVDVRAWGHNPATGSPYRYVRALVRKSAATAEAYRQATERWLSRHPRRPKKPAPRRKTGLPGEVYFPVQDTQYGRHRDRLGDIHTTFERAAWMAEHGLPDYVAAQRKAGINVETIVLPLGGDLTEGCDSKGDNRLYMLDANLIDQYEMAVSTVDRLVQAAVDLAPRVVLTGCSSNHDANARRGGKGNVTDGWDDRTFQLLRQIARLHERAPRGHLEVSMPPHPDVWLVEGHLNVAGIHGHIPKGSGPAAMKMWNWWKNEIANRRPAAAAQVLVACHYHHGYQLGPQSGRHLIGQPCWDNGSDYWEDGGGDWSLPGTTAFVATPDGLRGTETIVWDRDRELAREQTGQVVA